MSRIRQALLLLSSLCVALAAPVAFAHDWVQVGRNIHIDPGTPVGEVTCFMCSIYLRAPATGDVTAFGGSVNLDTGVSVGGDVTAFGGDIRIQPEVAVAGDATAFGGAVRRQPDTRISGDTTSMEGKGWILPVFAVPLVFLGLVAALIVWLASYLFRRHQPAVA